MLVRVYHTEQKTFKKAFDEQECRITRGLDHEEWAEFLLIWREQRLELYEDYVCVYTLSLPLNGSDKTTADIFDRTISRS